MSSALAIKSGGRTAGATDAARRRRHMLAAVYDEHGAAVFGLAHRITGDAGVAATLTAETFDDLETVTDETTLQACMLVDVHRRAVAWRRDRQPTGAAPAGERPSGTRSVVPQLDDERDLVAAAYFGGLTYRDLAAQLGKDGIEVAALLQRGLERLAGLTQPEAAGRLRA